MKNSTFALKQLAALCALGALAAPSWGLSYELREPLQGVRTTSSTGDSGSATPAPAFVVTPTGLTFAQIEAGQSSSLVLNVQNTGTGAGAVTKTAPAAPFSMTDNCGDSLASGQTCQATVTFAPTAEGSFQDTAIVAGTSVSLSGSAFAPTPVFSLSASSLTFASIEAGQTSSQTVTIQNVGTGAGAVTKTSPAAPFSLSDDCGASLAAGQSCQATVTFAPTAAGSFNGNATLAGAALSMTGSATPPPSIGAWSSAPGSTVVPTSYPANRTGTNKGYIYLRNEMVTAVTLTTDYVTAKTGAGAAALLAVEAVDNTGTPVYTSPTGCNNPDFIDGFSRQYDCSAIATGASSGGKHLRLTVGSGNAGTTVVVSVKLKSTGEIKTLTLPVQ